MTRHWHRPLPTALPVGPESSDEREPESERVSWWVGVTVAVVLLVLGYAGWRVVLLLA